LNSKRLIRSVPEINTLEPPKTETPKEPEQPEETMNQLKRASQLDEAAIAEILAAEEAKPKVELGIDNSNQSEEGSLPVYAGNFFEFSGLTQL
jgi:hypothetical protein